MRSLRARMSLNSVKFVTMLAVLLFAAAGTLRFMEAWVYLALQAVTIAITNEYLLARDPALLERRLRLDEHGETERTQKIVIGLSRALGAVMLVIAGLDRRLASYWAWMVMPFAMGLLIVRLLAEERLLTPRLPGYSDYVRETPRRLVPGIW